MKKSYLLKMEKFIVMSCLIAGAPVSSGCEEDISKPKMESTETNISFGDEDDHIYATLVLDNENYIIYDHDGGKQFDNGVYRIMVGQHEIIDISTSKIAATFIGDEDCSAHDIALKYLSVVNKDNKYPVIDYDDILPKYSGKVKRKTN